jgi:hypothetical protein
VKTSEVDSKDSLITQKEQLYVNLRKILMRQPGAEAAEQLKLYAQTLKEKRQQLKQTNNDLRMFQLKVRDYESDLEKLKQVLWEQMMKLLLLLL